jgi:hypothetical protein
MTLNPRIKPIIFKALLISAVLTSPFSVTANELPLKLVIIKDTVGSEYIVSGDLSSGINRLKRINMFEKTFENNMSLCVAYIKLNNVDKSESACSAAIKSTKSMPLHNEQAIYLKSLSYSNRGIARYLGQDLSGAIADLTTAISINSNVITKSNLRLISDLSVEPNESTTSQISG